MEIHVAAGTARGRTELAAYDAALADANLHNYNLVTVSSVVPAGASVRVVDEAPPLGPPGNRLTVVQARADATPADAHETERAVAGLGWATGPGPGLFYEATGADADVVRRTVEEGLADGRALREWEFTDEETLVAETDTSADAYTAAVVVAAYGESEPVA
ncbi:pyruvoyl-dependent arginine decarboxylase [Candidatus Halobonum tyrrellensis]|uniref:arginine decarboxylase n=1 Tax=Candidatus Halobonum tyrrellensis G22 TaxID=1324957 RepID=V4IW17_9EURY|nr:pyruvoyl-dependent arginine decarboxylase [Candidatus Halobonum tyrrellensis]ESP87352.1 pyruvoyl-dependent arginine decarboxylase [Candidatus Halobonum tyrrellensis G22]